MKRFLIAALLACLPATAFGQAQFTNSDGSHSPSVVIESATGTTTASPVTDTNSLPVHSTISGAAITLANPVPVMNVISGTAIGTTNPVPVQSLIGGAAIAAANPLAVQSIVGGAAIAATNPLPVGASKHALSSLLTRINNSSAYTATASAPQAICLFTSVTACVPVTITISTAAANNGNITGVRLIKSTTGATNATFLVLMYQAAPTIAASVFDASAYNPKLADITSNAFLGFWACGTEVANTDNATYECTSTNPSGNQPFSVTDGILRAVILTTGAYAPGSSETFQLQVDALTTVP